MRSEASAEKMGGRVHSGNVESDGGGKLGVRVENMNSGDGESGQMQPQAIFGFSLLQSLRGNPMEDFHVAEFREIDGEEVPIHLLSNCLRFQSISRLWNT